MVEKGKKHIRKGFFQGFSVFHLCGFYSVSAFLGAFFVGGNGKNFYLCNRKNKVRGYKPELRIEPQSCQQASKNRGVDDKDDDE